VTVAQRAVGGATVVTVSGELDGRAAELGQDVGAALRRSADVVLDLSGVRYLSSAGLRLMLIVYRQAQCLGTRVAVVGLSNELRMVMQASGFLGFFLVAGSPEDALRSLRAAARDDAAGAGRPADLTGSCAGAGR
jgi:anti-sigma B factor antagonist